MAVGWGSPSRGTSAGAATPLARRLAAAAAAAALLLAAAPVLAMLLLTQPADAFGRACSARVGSRRARNRAPRSLACPPTRARAGGSGRAHAQDTREFRTRVQNTTRKNARRRTTAGPTAPPRRATFQTSGAASWGTSSRCSRPSQTRLARRATRRGAPPPFYMEVPPTPPRPFVPRCSCPCPLPLPRNNTSAALTRPNTHAKHAPT